LNEAQELARRLNKLKLDFELETGETGKAFGSVTASDIAEKIRGELGGQTEIDRHRIILPKAIKDSGKHEVEVKLHHDVTAVLSVNITTKNSAAEAAKAADEGKESREKAAGEKTAGGYKAKAKAKHKEKE
jgi:large subunit ribosomal protein L9